MAAFSCKKRREVIGMPKVKIIETYHDLVLKKVIDADTEMNVTPERLEKLIEAGKAVEVKEAKK